MKCLIFVFELKDVFTLISTQTGTSCGLNTNLIVKKFTSLF